MYQQRHTKQILILRRNQSLTTVMGVKFRNTIKLPLRSKVKICYVCLWKNHPLYCGNDTDFRRCRGDKHLNPNWNSSIINISNKPYVYHKHFKFAWRFTSARADCSQDRLTFIKLWFILVVAILAYFLRALFWKRIVQTHSLAGCVRRRHTVLDRNRDRQPLRFHRTTHTLKIIKITDWKHLVEFLIYHQLYACNYYKISTNSISMVDLM